MPDPDGVVDFTFNHGGERVRDLALCSRVEKHSVLWTERGPQLEPRGQTHEHDSYNA